MKKTIYIFIVTVILIIGVQTDSVLAQGSLEFNQAIHLESTNTNTPQTFTVPAGKVWKITSFGGYSGRLSNTTSQRYYMKIGSTFATNAIDGYINNTNSDCTITRRGSTVSDVFWIPGGTVVELGFLTNSNASCNSVYANGIEFNIIP